MDRDGARKRWHQAEDGGYPPDSEDAAYAAVEKAPTSGGGEGKGVAERSGTSVGRPTPGNDALYASLAARQMDRWLASMERLRLAEYVRYVDDRKRLFWSSFVGGMARGVGMAVGFTILGAVLVLILQDLAKHNLPVIGDFLAQIVSVVQKRLE